MSETPALGCDFVGQDFGASYPDSVCIDGWLWDADSGDASGDGWEYTIGGDLPCPRCNREEAIDRKAEDLHDGHESMTMEAARIIAAEKVDGYVAHMTEKWETNQGLVPVDPKASR